MGKVFQNKMCDICATEGKVIETWGKKYCKSCWSKKPKYGNGHSGMLKGEKQIYTIPFYSGLFLERTKKGNKTYATIYLEHYPGSKGIVGRQLNYFIKYDGEIIGIIGCNSPPLNYLKFNKFFYKDYEKTVVNNNVFRLIKHTYYGSQILKIFRKRIVKDYYDTYGDFLYGITTFVEPPRTGIVYKADNWSALGQTQGVTCRRRGDHGKWINKEWGRGTVKYIFAKWLCRDHKIKKIKNAVEVSREIRTNTIGEGEGQYLDTAQ